MKKIIIKTTFLIFVIITNSFLTYSQIKTIDYLNSGLSTTSCNVFNPPFTIADVSHSSYAGGVLFSSTNGLILNTTIKNSP